MKDMPLTVRRSIELLGLVLIGLLIVIGQNIIMPLLMAFFISIVLLPVYRFFRLRKFPEVLSISLAILLLFILLFGLGWFFSSQVARLISDFPEIKKNVMLHLTHLGSWISDKTHVPVEKQVQMINDQSNKLLDYAGVLLGGTASSISSILVFIGLLPIYIFLILFYKNLLLRFAFLWFPSQSQDKLKEAMIETETIIKSYLVGLLIQITYITVLLGGALLVIGIKHALLIGVIFAILNLIPYVGALLGNIIGVLLTLTSSQDISPIFTVLITIAVVQFLDNNILMPRIVGSKVKINALATIVGVFIGGSIAGISGMFLSLPVIAVLKIVFDRTENFRQWGVLLGDENPKLSPMSFPILRRKSRRVTETLEKENNIKPTNEQTVNK